MQLNVLAVGDVCADAGVSFLDKHLRRLKREHQIHFTVVNGENASGVGLHPRQAESIFAAGADVITLGNHTWNRQQIIPMLDDNPCLLRPANFSPRTPGRGFGLFDGPQGLRIGVLNLMGRYGLDYHLDNPFVTADQILTREKADVFLIDFHAEATSEKGALGWYLDGRVSAVWGTHTHVPTADAQVLPKGTGFISDLGMTGPALSVLGIRPDQSISLFLGDLHQRYEAAPGPCKLESAIFTIDTASRRCLSVSRLDVQE